MPSEPTAFDCDTELAHRPKHRAIAAILGGELYGWNSQHSCTVRVNGSLYDISGPVYRTIESLANQRDTARIERDAERTKKDAAIRAAELYRGWSVPRPVAEYEAIRTKKIDEADALLTQARETTT